MCYKLVHFEPLQRDDWLVSNQLGNKKQEEEMHWMQNNLIFFVPRHNLICENFPTFIVVCQKVTLNISKLWKNTCLQLLPTQESAVTEHVRNCVQRAQCSVCFIV